MEQVYTPKQNYKVLVRCFTYNQSKYIEDALNGFAMQKTDFPFICLVMDDASTDGEQEVIKAWMERECDMSQAENVEIEKSFVIIVPHKTNVNCTFVFYFLKENLYKKGSKMPMVNPWRERCEYEALCEGDDYWIASEKLQKQVVFMDEHQDYAICHTGFTWYYVNSGRKEYANKEEERLLAYKDVYDCKVIIEAILNSDKYRIRTLTVLFRIEMFMKIKRDSVDFSSHFMMGDTQLFCHLLMIGKIKYIPENMCMYRVLEESASHFSKWTDKYKFYLNCAEMRCCLSDHLELSQPSIAYFQKQYQIESIINLLLCNNYAYFIPFEFSNLYRKLFYRIVTSKIVISVLSPWFRKSESTTWRFKNYLLKNIY